MKYEVDILIAGGGLVGLAFATALANTGYMVGVVAQALPSLLPVEEIDTRVYAISPRSRRFLHAAWSKIPTQRIAAIRQMVIAEQEQLSARLHLEALEVGADELATVIESHSLLTALWACVLDADNITCFMPHTIESVRVHPTYAEVKLDNQTVIHTKLLVGADGAQSFIRQEIGSTAKTHDYQQRGIVANFLCEKAHQGVAYQWFCPNGILAWLPLPDNKISMVWSADDVLARELMALSPEALAEQVSEMGKATLGKMTILNQPASFSLRLTHVPHWVSHRVALVGDAAHTVHPLAGQGVNLGFGDVEVLSRILSEKHVDPGQLRLLRQYERERREAVYLMQGVTHTLKTLFNNQNPILKPLRQFGLRCTDRMRFIKRQLIQAALD